MLPWAQPNPQPKRHHKMVQPFMHSSTHTLNGSLLHPLKIVPSRERPGPPYGSFGHLSPQPKRHLDRFTVTDRQTDRPTDWPTDHATPSVTMCHTYVRSTTMRPNCSNKNLLLSTRCSTILTSCFSNKANLIHRNLQPAFLLLEPPGDPPSPDLLHRASSQYVNK